MEPTNVVSLGPFFDQASGVVNVVVETPAGSQNKYDYDPQIGRFVLDRPIHSSLRYPFDYGFIPGTHAGDGDPLDAALVLNQSTFPGCVVHARVVGVMDMEDEDGRDHKLICVAATDPRMAHVQDVNQLPPHLLKEMEHFFIHIKDLEKQKWARVHGFRDRQSGLEVLGQSIAHEPSE